MKKTFKKFTSLALVLMLVFSVFSVQASAGLFDKIADVQIIAKEPVTARELDEYIEEIEEYGAEYDIDYYYYISAECVATLSTGEAIETEYGVGESKNGKRLVVMEAYVDVRDYLEVKESGADTLPLYYDVTLLSSIYIEMDTVKGEAEIPFTDCYVKSITPVSGLPEAFRDRGSFIWLVEDESYEEKFLEGAVFDVEYPDGTVKRGKVKIEEENGHCDALLFDEYISYYVDVDEDIIEIYYGDYIYTSEIEVIDFPLTEIVIDDVQISDSFEAQSVSFTVTKTDGTTESFVCDVTGEPDFDILGSIELYGCYVEDVPVVVYVEKYVDDDVYPSREYIYVTVDADYDVYAEKNIEGPEQEGNFLGEFIFRIRKFFEKIISFFDIISIN